MSDTKAPNSFEGEKKLEAYVAGDGYNSSTSAGSISSVKSLLELEKAMGDPNVSKEFKAMGEFELKYTRLGAKMIAENEYLADKFGRGLEGAIMAASILKRKAQADAFDEILKAYVPKDTTASSRAQKSVVSKLSTSSGSGSGLGTAP